MEEWMGKKKTSSFAKAMEDREGKEQGVLRPFENPFEHLTVPSKVEGLRAFDRIDLPEA